VPLEPKLWEIQNYRDFLDRRRKSIAEAINGFMNALE
jgi:hypothetical protein